MVLKMRLELIRACARKPLKLVCLPFHHLSIMVAKVGFEPTHLKIPHLKCGASASSAIRPLVVPEGAEPSSSVCKTDVMPVIPRDYIQDTVTRALPLSNKSSKVDLIGFEPILRDFKSLCFSCMCLYGGPWGDRIPDLLLARQALVPAELMAHSKMNTRGANRNFN